MLIAAFGNNWALYMVLIELPNYMKNILHFNTKTVSIWNKHMTTTIKNNNRFLYVGV